MDQTEWQIIRSDFATISKREMWAVESSITSMKWSMKEELPTWDALKSYVSFMVQYLRHIRIRHSYLLQLEIGNTRHVTGVMFPVLTRRCDVRCHGHVINSHEDFLSACVSNTTGGVSVCFYQVDTVFFLHSLHRTVRDRYIFPYCVYIEP